MYKVNKLALTASVLTVGMMSSAITLANTADTANIQDAAQTQQSQQKTGSFADNSGNLEEQEKETQGLNLGSSNANYSVDTNTGAEIVKEMTHSNTTIQVESGPKSETVATTSSSNNEAGTTYPSFSSEEIVSINMQSQFSEEEAPVEGEQPEEIELEYKPDVAVLYQHLPENPIYTYGVDGSGKGQCTGTECEEFAAIWDEFEKRQAEGETLIITEEGDPREGKIAMPASFADNVKNQPAIEPNNKAQDCPTGYTYSADGNEYQNSAHCGKMDGNTYYLADPQ